METEIFPDFRELSALRKTNLICACLRFPGLIMAVAIGNLISCVPAESTRVTSYMLVAPNDSETLVEPFDKVWVTTTVSGPEAFCLPKVTVPWTLDPSSQRALIERLVVDVCGRAGSAKTVVRHRMVTAR